MNITINTKLITSATSIQACDPHTLSCSSSAQCKISSSNCNFPECSSTLASAAVTNGRYQSADGPLPTTNPEQQTERDTKNETDKERQIKGNRERDCFHTSFPARNFHCGCVCDIWILWILIGPADQGDWISISLSITH